MEKEKTIENLSTDELIKALRICGNGKLACIGCEFWGTTNCGNKLKNAAADRLEQLQQELIDKAELLKAATDILVACAYKIFFADTENTTPLCCSSPLCCPSSEREDTANASSADYPTSVTNGDNSIPTKTQNVVLVQFCKGSKKYLYALPERSKVREGMALVVKNGDIGRACCDSFFVGGAALDALVELTGAKLPLTFVSGVVLYLTPDE